MLLRRVCSVALTIGLLVVAACGDVEPRARTFGRSPVEIAKHPPPTVPVDVEGALGAVAHVVRVMFPPTTITTPPSTSTTAPVVSGGMTNPDEGEASDSVNGYPCGGSLPPCYVLERESHGNPYAVEPGHQGAPYGDPGDPWHHASGLWQAMPSTWGGYAGYPYAAAAPVSVQNEWARLLWDGGRGCGHWSSC